MGRDTLHFVTLSFFRFIQICPGSCILNNYEGKEDLLGWITSEEALAEKKNSDISTPRTPRKPCRQLRDICRYLFNDSNDGEKDSN